MYLVLMDVTEQIKCRTSSPFDTLAQQIRLSSQIKIRVLQKTDIVKIAIY
jgi:hypothetical protein